MSPYFVGPELSGISLFIKPIEDYSKKSVGETFIELVKCRHCTREYHRMVHKCDNTAVRQLTEEIQLVGID